MDMPLPSTSVLGALRSFHVVATKLSFTKAAADLCVTQGAVSQQIRLLEQHLGLKLFIRSARALTLTEKGEALHKVMTRVFSDTEAILEELQTPDAPLQISCSPSFALHWLTPRLADFNAQHPHVPVRLIAEFQDLDCEELARGRIDIAIRYDPKKYNDVAAEDLLDEFIIPVSTPSFAEKAQPLEIRNVHLLHDNEPWTGAPEYCEWNDWIKENTDDYKCTIGGSQFNLSSLALGSALKNQGMAMGRMALVYDDILSGRLVFPFGKAIPARARYVLICRDAADRRVNVFTNWLRTECAYFRRQRDSMLKSMPTEARSLKNR
ncbi:LysR substrate-binding domain-containing protein [Acetobacter senegalensis]|uniref:LysR substrate-binding domain-containing protein n=2 Tax=Acetobacter senegalensis TaxID=446692 RepID=UPI00209F10A2|nr:LysR substrate-binding domain-containing protein [Acetobacter senegalensis]MCP1196445.1 LysR substrate-binding domain-containing protein [Acetobacter senegalensis]